MFLQLAWINTELLQPNMFSIILVIFLLIFTSDASMVENNLWSSATMTTTDVTRANWTVSGTSGNYITVCGSYSLVGGVGFFGAFAKMSRIYTSLNPHLWVRITFYLMKEGDWNNTFQGNVDKNQTIIFFSSSTDTSKFKFCGPTGFTDVLRKVDLLFLHNSTKMNIYITSDLTLNAFNASWGIFNYSMTIFLCDSSCLTCNAANDASQCMSCPSGTYLKTLVGPAQCVSTCPNHTYPDKVTNICQVCDFTCEICENSASNCISCQMGWYLTSKHLCLINCPNNEFMFFDQKKCYSVCPEGYYGNILDFTCVLICPNGTFKNSNHTLCEICSFDCQTCSQTSFYCGGCKYDWLSKAPYCSISESF